MSCYKGSTGIGNGSSGESSEGEDQDESSSCIKSTEEALEDFRQKWQRELKVTPKHKADQKKSIRNDKSPQPQNVGISDDYETRARYLFSSGIDMERSGKLYEAIQFYRKAIQLVPDIEFRLHNFSSKPKVMRERQVTESSEEDKPEKYDSGSNDSDDDNFKESELLPRIQRKINKKGIICVPNFEQKVTHISSLPMEIILYILRWLVSSDLDFRSLEIFGQVCRGFYLCARDPEIWRLACLRVWGLNCGSSPSSYGSWRQMFIERPRLRFNGCYISKTTYIRHGENSFQDQFYRPWHLVAYYRYFRFFPEGTVLMLTSAEEPIQCVGLLRSRQAKAPVLSGYYRLKDNKVSLIVHRQEPKLIQNLKKAKRKDNLHDSAEQTFHMELQIMNHNKKKHVQLAWSHYSVHTTFRKGDESTCNFDLIQNRFPPAYFSRVRSYTAESESPLQ